MGWIRWAYGQVHWCKRRLCPSNPVVRSQIHINKLPWFWIGAELSTGTKPVTEIVNNYVRYGITINPEFLQEVTGYTNAISWKYIDVETLEEKEFPSHGFVIENVTSN